MLTGSTSKGKDYAAAAKTETGRWQATRSAHGRESELLSAKGEVEYGVALVTAAKSTRFGGPGVSLSSRSRLSDWGDSDAPSRSTCHFGSTLVRSHRTRPPTCYLQASCGPVGL